MIGSYGNVVFEVSAEKVRTFTDFTRTERGRWAETTRIGQKPISEFLAPELGSISFEMHFNAQMGVNPLKETDKLIVMVREGKVAPLILGSKRFGVSKWSIREVSVDYTQIDNRGNILKAVAKVSLEEYV